MLIKKKIGLREGIEPLVGLIAGLDEAGRGPIAGPVMAAAVILDPRHPIDGLNDSKQLSQAKRDQLSPLIKKNALSWAVAEASVEEIDEINILQASLLAMRRALLNLSLQPDGVYIDGNQFILCDYSMYAIVGGDARVSAISAASILAKTERDKYMLNLHQQYPYYGFAQHKGYPTQHHLKMLAEHGVSCHHRKSFRPVRERI
ncbi:MAG: ribonuclease HII [Ferrovum sp. 37-45-19]|uniref:ribonuclease HII n=1 Tax=Ferrovum sp. JA12 TaxID=1356299 RepID=UPI000702CD6A|nr:ribonuclease HII [Ferrovum sp. JA12]KRH79845.1 ribonuclease HII [Ferrovum sp. JA12]OYV95320.1 MAG: ribonuclease HII [Ferrovum sp. 37-45-19]OZB33732.1 MAG: ribonuclease HII [Ferrovum sp. 34-44-207]